MVKQVGVLEWCLVTIAGYAAAAAAAAAQVCAKKSGHSETPPDVLSPTHPRSPSDILMVHAMCVSVADR